MAATGKICPGMRPGGPPWPLRRRGEGENGPAALAGDLAEAAVRVDRVRMTDGLEQRQVGGRIAVGVAVRQPVATLGGQGANHGRLGLTVGVELHLTRVPA